MNNILTNASTTCLQSIDQYCKTNSTNNSLCACWNPNNPISTTETCKNFRSIFSGVKLYSLDNIDANTLDIIKKKNNLCDCGNMNAPVTTPPVKIKPVVIPAPKLLDTFYSINASDIDVYNSYRGA
jgi:hypothetical protein